MATDELVRRELGVTSQVLSVHAPPQPIPVAIDTTTEATAVFFFFAIPDEPYHFWVRVARSSAQLEFAGVTPLTTLELLIVSEATTPEEITQQLGVAPSRTLTLGQPRRPGAAPSQKTWEPLPRSAGFFEKRIEAFLSAVRPLSPKLRALQHCETELAIASYQWSAWPDGFHLSNHAANLAAELGASVDIDLYCSGPPELGA